MSIKSPLDIIRKSESGGITGPIQYPSTLQGDGTNKYVVHFHIKSPVEGRYQGRRTRHINGATGNEPNKFVEGDNEQVFVKSEGKGKRPKDIYLYMPENITESFSHDWEGTELGSIKRLSDLAEMGLTGRGGDAFGQIKEQLKKMGVSAVEGVTALNANSLREANTGIIMNPNIELLYRGSQLKQHNFQFKFIPKSKKEAIAAKKIIEMFKYHSAPSLPGGSKSVLLRYPDVFEIKFVYTGNGKNQQNSQGWMHRIGICALTNVEVNYTGAGQFSSFKDGAPVHTEISLQFQELTVETREKIESGFSDTDDIRGILD